MSKDGLCHLRRLFVAGLLVVLLSVVVVVGLLIFHYGLQPDHWKRANIARKINKGNIVLVSIIFAAGTGLGFLVMPPRRRKRRRIGSFRGESCVVPR